MDRVNGADWVDIGGGRRGFRSQNAVAGVSGTEVTADWLNGLQEELVGLVLAAGLVPDGADWTQLLKAVRSQRTNWVTAGGDGTAITVALGAPAPTSYDDLVGVPLRFLATAANEADPTFNINGLGEKDLVWPDASAIRANSWSAGQILEVIFNGTAVVVLAGATAAADRFTNRLTITDTGADTFTPTFTGLHRVTLRGPGAGGGGGSGNGAGGGGGGGGYIQDYLHLTAGVDEPYTVGTGGDGAAGGGLTGAPGTSTTFGGLTATSGSPGQPANAGQSANGGPGGSASGGSASALVRLGQSGYQGASQIAQGGKGGQGGGIGGGLGGPPSFGNGNAGSPPGGGGSGSSGGGYGGAGARGEIEIEW